MAKVSILIPIYNVEKYLRQCLDSVVNQTLQDIEIICINDGSTDSSPKIIREFADKDPRIKVIDKHNTGYGHSMNQGLRAATGEYIGIVESDDFVELNMFETLYDTAKNVGAEIVKSNWFRQMGNDFILKNVVDSSSTQIFKPNKKHANIFFISIAIWSAIYQRDFLLKNNIYFNETPGASYQDVSFAFKVYFCANKVYLLKDAFLHYRINNPNSSMKSKQKVYFIFDEFEEIENFLNERKDISSQCRYVVEEFKFRHYMSNYSRIDDSFKFDFLERMYKEFENDKSAGFLDENYWSRDKWIDVQKLLNNKEEFYYGQYLLIQKINIYKHGIYEIINLFKNIYIYGAGFVAMKTINNLFVKRVSIAGVIVTNIQKSPNMFMGISVNNLESSNADKEKDLIIIAIKQTDQAEVLYKLQKLGYKNILIMTPELQRAL